jgi:hypothetical protein
MSYDAMSLQFFLFHSDAFCSLGDAMSIDISSQTSGTTQSKHFCPDISSKKDKCSSAFLNVGSDNESEIYSCSQQIPRYNSNRSDSFIVFETSCGQESELSVDDVKDSEHSCEDGLEAMESDRREGENVLPCTSSSETSSKCFSAWGEETRRKRASSTTECHNVKKKIGHRRPLSLDISSGGEIVLPPPKASRMFLFIQMQLCRRESLREWLRDNVSNRSTCVVLPMFEQIVQAVEYVHLQGLIHRDLKVRSIYYLFICLFDNTVNYIGCKQ